MLRLECTVRETENEKAKLENGKSKLGNRKSKEQKTKNEKRKTKSEKRRAKIGASEPSVVPARRDQRSVAADAG
jgi:hypothetical protein